MASTGYYYQPAPGYYTHSPEQRAVSSFSTFLFLATVSVLAATTLLALCESAVETLVHQLRGFLVLSPVLLVIAVQIWVGLASGGGGGLAELASGGHREQYYCYDGYGYRGHGHGSSGSSSASPWGVALALVLVLLLVTHQSWIHERWFWPVNAAVCLICAQISTRIFF